MKVFIGNCIGAIIIAGVAVLASYFIHIKFGFDLSLMLIVSLFVVAIYCSINASITARSSKHNFAAFKQMEAEKEMAELFWDFVEPEERAKWFKEEKQSPSLQVKRKELLDRINYWSNQRIG
uniref:hypothetical protein n=1 Tax=Edwardsiella ictaluri TaxID=67780 RepID=UPI00155D9259|nr:hypothetical protein [Edwardsiella ictaluri]